jgi:lipoprotein NlpI
MEDLAPSVHEALLLKFREGEKILFTARGPKGDDEGAMWVILTTESLYFTDGEQISDIPVSEVEQALVLKGQRELKVSSRSGDGRFMAFEKEKGAVFDELAGLILKERDRKRGKRVDPFMYISTWDDTRVEEVIRRPPRSRRSRRMRPRRIRSPMEERESRARPAAWAFVIFIAVALLFAAGRYIFFVAPESREDPAPKPRPRSVARPKPRSTRIDPPRTVRPGEWAYQYELGVKALEEHDYTKAHKAFTAAIDADASHWQAFFSRALVREKLGDRDGAIRDYTVVLALTPADREALYRRGCAYFDKGAWSKAFFDLKRVPWLDHERFRKARLRVWVIRARQGDRELADAELRDWLRWYADEKGWALRIALYLLGRLDEEAFLDSFEPPTLAEAGPRACEGWFYVAQKALIEGKRKKALKYFERSLASGAAEVTEYTSAAAEILRMTE